MRATVRGPVRSTSVMVPITTTATTVTGWATLELLILLCYVGDQVFAKLLGLLDHVRVRTAEVYEYAVLGSSFGHLRDMEEHVLVAFSVRCGFEVTRPAALDLHSATSFLLYMLHIGPAMPDYLSAQVESVNRF